MARLYVGLSEEQCDLLVQHWSFYIALDKGPRKPNTPAQRHFVSVCHAMCAPETEHELAYLAGRKLAENSVLSVSELRLRKFRVSPRDMKETPAVSSSGAGQPIEHHAVDVSRFSTKRRYVPRPNW